MLDVHRLRLLREVARRGSFSAAAQALSYTPSAVSQQIATLEREAGARLVERGPRGVTLTAPGRILVDRAEDVFRGLAAAERELREYAEMRSGLLRLGWFATAGTTLIPWAIAEFRGIAPGVRLDLFEGDPDQCVPRLLAREDELALVYRFEHEPPLDPALEQIELFDDQLHIGLPPGHRLAGRDRLTLADLAEDPWIQGVREGSTLGVLPRACRLAGFEPVVALRTDDRMAVEGLVAAGVGIALFPRLTLPAVRPDIVIRPLEAGPDAEALFRRVSIALPPGEYRSPAALTMIDVLRRTCARLSTEAARRLEGG